MASRSACVTGLCAPQGWSLLPEVVGPARVAGLMAVFCACAAVKRDITVKNKERPFFIFLIYVVFYRTRHLPEQAGINGNLAPFHQGPSPIDRKRVRIFWPGRKAIP